MNASVTSPGEVLDALRARFADQLSAKIDALAARWSELGETLNDSEGLQDLELMAHNLAGAGATFGYPRVSEVAKRLENLISCALDPEATLSIDPVASIGRLIAALQKAARAPAEHKAGIMPPRGKRHASSRERHVVFLVDDDVHQATLLATEIRHFGYEVEVFRSPNELERALASARPDMILMDIVFPEGADHGLQRMTALNDSVEDDIAVSFMSTREDFAARLAAVRAGALDYFVKPVDPIKLIERLDQLTAAHTPAPYRVLIVEDNPELAEAYSAALRGAGMQVEFESDPWHVTARIEELDPELILMDLYLPRCSGLDLAKVIRQQERYTSTPIVFLSTEGRLDRQLIAMSLGGDDFLTKPIMPDHLVAAVSSRVRRARVLRALMVRDSMTGLLNHASILEHLRTEIARASRSGVPCAFALLDLDHFKRINDTYGHPVGDRVIKSLARLMQQRLRKTDAIGRYGGEEFALVLPGVGSEEACKVVSELGRCFRALTHTAGGETFNATFSAGIGTCPEYGSAGIITEAADGALYRAKQDGRDRVAIAARRGAVKDCVA